MEPDAQRIQSNPDLVEEIRGAIEREGRITFARFMQEALYHPRFGYYLGDTARPGRAGDFLTAPEAHPIFGQTLARQIDEMWHRLGQPDPFTLREYGAGAGTLALSILEALRLDAPDALSAIRYEPVEINPRRRADLRDRLADAGFSGHVAEPDESRAFQGVALANEFVDALPVHRVEQRGGQLREVYVTWRDGQFAEETGPPSTSKIAEQLENEGIALQEGQRAEVNLGAAGWIGEVARSLERGYVLILDYGYPAAEQYGSARRAGTLKAYVRHTVHENPYRAVGEQDLTAHVDFTALEHAAHQHGMRVLGLTTQADFLAGAGIGEVLVAMQTRSGITLEEYLAARSAVMHLIDPGAMGRFHVLILGRDVPEEPKLRGLLGAS